MHICSHFRPNGEVSMDKVGKPRCKKTNNSLWHPIYTPEIIVFYEIVYLIKTR